MENEQITGETINSAIGTPYRLFESAYHDAIENGLDEMRKVRKKAKGSSVSNRFSIQDETIDETFIRFRKKIRKKDSKFHFVNRVARAMAYHDIIARCRNAYREHGIIRNVIDLLANFISKVHIYRSDPKWHQFYQAWAARVNLNERLNTFARDVLSHGQVCIYRIMAEISKSDKRTMRRTMADADYIRDDDALIIQDSDKTDVVEPKINKKICAFTKADFGEKPKNRANFIPWDYKSLNVLQLEPTGGIFQGESKWRFLLNKEDLDEMGLNTVRQHIDEGKSLSDLPDDFKDRIAPNPSFSLFDLQVALPNDRIYMIFDKKFDWEHWAVPMVYPALRNLKLKLCLRNMEARAAQSVISSIMLIKLGVITNEGKYIGPPPGAVEDIGEMLREPGQSTHIVWPTPDITAEYVQPDMGDIFGRDKIEGVDADILADLGASEVVVNGRGGGNYSNAFLSVSAMLERLENIREKFKAWLTRELRILGEAVGDTKVPSVKFETKSLRDERVRNDFMVKLFQMGRLSARTMWEYADIDADCEMARLKDEEEKVKRGEMLPAKGPFKDQVRDIVVKEQMSEDEDGILPSREEQMEQRIEEQRSLQDQEGEQPNQRGRPPGSEKPQEVVRDTKPQGMGRIDKELYEQNKKEGERILREVRTLIYKDALITADVTKRSDLSPNMINHIEGLAEEILSHANPSDQIDKNYLQKFYTEGPAKLDRCVKNVMSQKLSSFRKDNKKEPSEAQRKKMLSSSWAICRSQLKM